MKPIHTKTLLATLAASTTLAAGSAFAVPIDEWTPLSGATPVNSGLTTDSPTFGNNTADNAAGQFVAGQFGETVSLAIGETLTVSYDITTVGGSNSSNALRLVVGEYNTVSINDWAGGWMSRTATDLYQARTDGNVQSTTGNAVDLTGVLASTGAIDGNSTTAYAYTMTITRDSATTVDLAVSLVGGDGALDSVFTVEDLTTTQFDYNGVAIFSTGDSGYDQILISGAQFNVVPEPSSLALLGLGGLLIARRRRG